MGAKAILLKGGHANGEMLEDVIYTQEADYRVTHPRLDTPHTHGTGCTLASAMATLLAQGLDWQAALQRATDYVHQAIEDAPGFGQGHGPLG